MSSKFKERGYYFYPHLAAAQAEKNKTDDGKAKIRAWKATPSGQRSMRSAKMKNRYGITLEQYELMLASQSGACAICKSFTELVIDHNHETNEVRGLLCRPCNFAIGALREDKDIMLAAIEYIS
jgi:hypothetical protein